MNQETKNWNKSCYSRFVGLGFWTAFMLFTFNAKDIFSHAIIQVILVILTFYFIIVLPDKIIFGQRLVDIKHSSNHGDTHK